MRALMNTESVRLWQLISPALPVGGFHYSRGLEQAVERSWVTDAQGAEDWIGGVFREVVAWTDLPLVKRIHGAWCAGDEAVVVHWNAVSVACRETAELREEERQMGLALSRLGRAMDEPMPAVALGYTGAFAVLAANNRVCAADAMMGYGWAWCENQVTAAVKLVPLGHGVGQQILRRLGDELPAVVATAEQCADEQIGRTAQGFVLASSVHETQYTRLFRS